MELAALVCGFSSVACRSDVATNEKTIADLKSRSDDLSKGMASTVKDCGSEMADRVNEVDKRVTASSNSDGPAQFKKELTEMTEKYAHPSGDHIKTVREEVSKHIKTAFVSELQESENKLKEVVEAWNKVHASPEKSENLNTLESKVEAYSKYTAGLKSASTSASVFDTLFAIVNSQLLEKFGTDSSAMVSKYEKFAHEIIVFVSSKIAENTKTVCGARRDLAAKKAQGSAYGIVSDAEINTEFGKRYDEHCAKLDEESRKNTKKMNELFAKLKQDISKFNDEILEFNQSNINSVSVFTHWVQALTSVIDESYATVIDSGAKTQYVAGWFVKDDLLDDYCKTMESFGDKIATSFKEKCTFAGTKSSGASTTGADEAAPAADAKTETETVWYNTWWFYTLCIVAGALILGGVAYALMNSSK